MTGYGPARIQRSDRGSSDPGWVGGEVHGQPELRCVRAQAMSDVAPTESGLASGIVNTSFMMGGALGLAVLASLAASRTQALHDAGASQAAALDGGYQAAFLVGALFAGLAAALGGVLLRTRAAPTEGRVESAAT